MNVSPIMYNGCKRRLLQKILPMFPQNIHTFYDLFGGSGIVSMNVDAQSYFFNDINPHLLELYNAYREYDSNTIIQHIELRIEEYGLPKVRTKESREMRDSFKPSYEKLRSFYNETHNVLDFITLCFFSFSQQFRFNGAKFNMPMGSDIFCAKNKEAIQQGCKFFSQPNITFSNKSVFDIDLSNTKTDDFVYLDPPYFNTTATYNECNGWTLQDDNRLFDLLDELSKKGIKWCMSNVFECKGKTNEHLRKWVREKDYIVRHLDVKYSAFGKGNSNNNEVLIMNYEPIEKNKQLTLF